MKDETCGMSIKCFVGSKTKIYTYIAEDGHGYKKAKDINNNL